MFQQLRLPGADFNDPETYAMLATSFEASEKDRAEPAEVTEQLLPYRLLNELQQQADDLVSYDLVRRIRANAQRCAPIWRAAVRDWRERPEFFSPAAVQLILALLGEIAGPEALEELLDLIDAADAGVFLHANWA